MVCLRSSRGSSVGLGFQHDPPVTTVVVDRLTILHILCGTIHLRKSDKH